MNSHNFTSKIIILSLTLLVIGWFFVPRIVSADDIGQQVNFSIAPDFDVQSRSNVSASLHFISNKAYWYVADEYWNAIDNTARADLIGSINKLANEFDNKIYPGETSFYGSEPNPGVDNDPRITILLTPLKSSAGGYVDTANEYSKADVGSSNAREMIYVNVDFVGDFERIRAYVSHEFQHLISYYQKDVLLSAPDDVWLNELRSEYAIEYLGFYNDSISNNIGRRANTLLHNTTDSLTEWKNEAADYGSISMFAHYVGKIFNPQIIGMTEREKDPGIRAINDSLNAEGYTTPFDVIFGSWWAANLINDSTSQFFGYQLPALKDFHVRPEKIIILGSPQNNVSLSLVIKDWQGGWYEFDRPTNGNNFLGINFDSTSIASFDVALVKLNTNGQYEISYSGLDSQHTNLVLDYSDLSVSKYFVMPFKKDRLSGFGVNETAVILNMIAQTSAMNIPGNIMLTKITPDIFHVNSQSANPSPSSSLKATPVQYGLHEGDFIRATGDNDVYIINDYGYKRLVINPSICLMYGHLGARGCFSAVKIVSPEVRDAFTTSFFVTNGETRDDIVYELIMINEDQAKIKLVSKTSNEFLNQGYDVHQIFQINSNEQRSYVK